VHDVSKGIYIMDVSNYQYNYRSARKYVQVINEVDLLASAGLFDRNECHVRKGIQSTNPLLALARALLSRFSCYSSLRFLSLRQNDSTSTFEKRIKKSSTIFCAMTQHYDANANVRTSFFLNIILTTRLLRKQLPRKKKLQRYELNAVFHISNFPATCDLIG